MAQDITELRSEYLFGFAHLCGISPREVDRLKCPDFYQMIMSIDAYIEAQKQQ